MSALTIENNVLTAYLHRDHHDFDTVSQQAQAVIDEHTREDDVTVFGSAGRTSRADGAHWGRPHLSDLFAILSRYNDLTVVFDLGAGRGEITGVDQDSPSAALLPVSVLRGEKAELWADWCDWNSEHNAITEDPAHQIVAMSGAYAAMVFGLSEGHVSIAEQVPYTADWTPNEIGYELLVRALETLGLDQADPVTQGRLAQVGKTWQGSLTDLVAAVTAAAAA